MEKGVLLIAASIVLLVVIILGCQPVIKKEVDYSQATPNYTAEILQKFQESEYVRVTVILKEPPTNLINQSDPIVRGLKKKEYTENITKHVLSGLDQDKYELIGTLTYAFIARINKETYERLLNDPYVKEILPDREVRTV